jgi:hypothetical protein
MHSIFQGLWIHLPVSSDERHTLCHVQLHPSSASQPDKTEPRGSHSQKNDQAGSIDAQHLIYICTHTETVKKQYAYVCVNTAYVTEIHTLRQKYSYQMLYYLRQISKSVTSNIRESMFSQINVFLMFFCPLMRVIMGYSVPKHRQP